ncbi:hypothetical protein [Roseococcus sp. YIM B11640]|uniref:hypothetical protein n=1 Tax=Roseococcus sp. YIM B11640 TaxID=3133973 RepID=UPI003C7DBF5B
MKRVLLMSLLAVPAMAQERPAFFPERDVAVVYRLGGSEGISREVAASWSASRQMLRVEMPGIGWSVLNRRAQTGFIIIEGSRRVTAMPPDMLRRQLGPSPRVRFTRRGQDRVAGEGCTVWAFRDRSTEGTLCVTPDGLLLRSDAISDGVRGSIEAVAVSYADQGAVSFAVPPGYRWTSRPPARLAPTSPGG